MKALRIGVSVTVVLVAAAVAWGSLGRRTAEAGRAESLRNLRQWGIALNLFLADNDNQLPDVGSAPVSAEQTRAWFNVLPPSISQKPLTALPPGQRPRPGVPSLWMNPLLPPARHWDPGVFFFSYAMNRALQPDPAARGFRIYEIAHPGHVVFLAEVDQFDPHCSPESIVAFENGRRSTRPSATTGVLFCDGHARPVLLSELTDPAALRAANAESGVSWFLK